MCDCGAGIDILLSKLPESVLRCQLPPRIINQRGAIMPTSEVPGRPASTTAAAVLYGPGDLRIERRPVPAPGPGQVLVRVGSAGVCGSERVLFEGRRPGGVVGRPPLELGVE